MKKNSSKINPVLVGAFVLGALILAVAGLIAFGTMHLFSKPSRFIAYFDESVQGLDLGSAVKVGGVRVGHVAEIRVRYDTQTRKSTVAVTGEMEHNLITDSHGTIIKLTDTHALQGLIDEGLRAKLKLTGITGMQVIELDFMDPKKYPARPVAEAGGIPVMPTVTSPFAELADSAAELFSTLKKIDFSGLAGGLQSLVTNANAKISGLDLKGMITRITAAADSVEQLAGGPETKTVVTNLNQTILEVRTLATNLVTQTATLGSELKASLETFNGAAEAVQKSLGPEGGLKDGAASALRRLSDAAAAVQQLADYLERNPSALLTGKKLPGK